MILADDGYSGKPMIDYVREEYDWQFVSVKRTELHQFKVMPKRWVVERTIGWMNNGRGLSKHSDYHAKTSESKIYLASYFLHEQKVGNKTQLNNVGPRKRRKNQSKNRNF